MSAKPADRAHGRRGQTELNNDDAPAGDRGSPNQIAEVRTVDPRAASVSCKLRTKPPASSTVVNYLGLEDLDEGWRDNPQAASLEGRVFVLAFIVVWSLERRRARSCPRNFGFA